MKLRAPAVPLINIDPYFSVWSMGNKLNGSVTKHWTGKENIINGTVKIDGEPFIFMGDFPGMAKINQLFLDINALTTTYIFGNDKIELDVRFTSALLPYNLNIMTRPVTFLSICYKTLDGKAHDVVVNISVSEQLCLNEKHEHEVETDIVPIEKIPCIRMGSKTQEILNRSGDDLRIDWGYVYLGVNDENGSVSVFHCDITDMQFIKARCKLKEGCRTLWLFAYDDIESIDYFGDHLKSVWNHEGSTINEAILSAASEYDLLYKECEEFSAKLFSDALKAGGEKYAELLSLAYRQVINAHKTVYDKDGKILFISKECFSNGCAATVDVSYPSIPMFLLYNPELIKGMMRPIYKYASSDVWCFDFAPHDAGTYPLVNGQVYSGGTNPDQQMPVEECGNMLIMETAVAVAENDASFALSHWDILTKWVKYLEQYGEDPGNQLCTDDFAGHLAHNCNLSIKATMGIAGFGILNRMAGKKEEADYYLEKAKRFADSYAKRASNSNGDGSYRLAYDQDFTFSMKYNAVWDKLFGTKLFAPEVMQSEAASCFSHVNPYGMPLDNRADYTKSDWLTWTATLFNNDDDFERFIEPMWNAYNYSKSRIPMTDWYDTITANVLHFQNRSVQGGLFIKMLEKSGKMKIM